MSSSDSTTEPAAGPTLKRSLSLPLVILYGLGTTVGAGIFVLVGKVAGVAGYQAPLAFALAAGLAGLTAFSFTELAARFPRSAGEAVYVQEGLGLPALTLAVGLTVALAGIVSSAAVTNGFVGYFHEFLDLPGPLVLGLVILILGGLAAWGIGEAVTAAALFTVLEVGGLVWVIWDGRDLAPEIWARLPDMAPDPSLVGVSGVLTGAILAFYAFIGFEDIVNVAEETRNPTRTLPAAIIWTLVVTTILYLLVAAVAVTAVAPERLSESAAPLAVVHETLTGGGAHGISLIAMVAVVNGALIQIIMATRVLYGLAAMGRLPAPLAKIDRRTRTPLIATVTVTILVLLFAYWLPLATLAETTSLLLLIVFSLVNLALLRVKRKTPAPQGMWTVPIWVPGAGFLVSLIFLIIGLVGI